MPANWGIAFFQAEQLLGNRAGDGELELVAENFLPLGGQDDHVDEGIVSFRDPNEKRAGTAGDDERCTRLLSNNRADAEAGALEAETAKRVTGVSFVEP